jgi:hypothetical protein
MSSLTFIGIVHQGRVELPAEFEGKRVKVTEAEEVALGATASREAEPLEDPGRIDLPPGDVTTVKARIVDVPPRSMPVYAEEEDVVGGELDDFGLIDLPPDEVSTVKVRVTDVGAPPMRVYSEDD